MCAIFGLGFLSGSSFKDSKRIRSIVRKLFIYNQDRGRTASGIAYVSSGEIKVLKTDVGADEFIKLPEFDRAENKYMELGEPSESCSNGVSEYPPVAVLGHCRLKTQGSEKNNDNNHPIIYENVVGVHNGCIHNDGQLFREYDESFKRIGQVDSEIIFALVNYFSITKPIHEAITMMAKIVYGSMACAMCHRDYQHIVWLFRKSSPCDVLLFPEVGLVIWSSSDSYIYKAVKNCPELATSTKISLPEYSGLGIDLMSNKIHRFDLSPEVNEFGYMYGQSF